MSFKSYISVDFSLPDDFYDWEERAQEKYWNNVYSVQANAEEAYCKVIDKKLEKLGCEDIDVGIESK